jgi:hypothetical protein
MVRCNCGAAAPMHHAAHHRHRACRRGYDVASFAAAGAALSVGLDLSREAADAADAECRRRLAGSPAAAAACQLTAGDFFTYTPPPDAAAGDGAGHGASSGAPLFDAGYDYTFLCALHPDMRQVCALHVVRQADVRVFFFFWGGGGGRCPNPVNRASPVQQLQAHPPHQPHAPPPRPHTLPLTAARRTVRARHRTGRRRGRASSGQAAAS